MGRHRVQDLGYYMRIPPKMEKSNGTDRRWKLGVYRNYHEESPISFRGLFEAPYTINARMLVVRGDPYRASTIFSASKDAGLLAGH